MLKLLVGFGSIIFFLIMIILIIYYIRQYLKESDEEDNHDESFDRQSKDVLSEIEMCISFLSSLQSSSVREVIAPMEKIIHIIERYPDKSENMQELTEYIIPLTKRLADDYCFHQRHAKDSANSIKAMETCGQGLREISNILYKKADSMLEEQYYDLRTDVAVLSQVYPDDTLLNRPQRSN